MLLVSCLSDAVGRWLSASMLRWQDLVRFHDVEPGQLHRVLVDNKKLKPCTTSCQLRYGIEHVFRTDPNPLAIIFHSVGFS